MWTEEIGGILSCVTLPTPNISYNRSYPHLELSHLLPLPHCLRPIPRQSLDQSRTGNEVFTRYFLSFVHGNHSSISYCCILILQNTVCQIIKDSYSRFVVPVLANSWQLVCIIVHTCILTLTLYAADILYIFDRHTFIFYGLQHRISLGYSLLSLWLCHTYRYLLPVQYTCTCIIDGGQTPRQHSDMSLRTSWVCWEPEWKQIDTEHL